ncbi:hypothetical protein [Nocardia sp. NPDC127526]|uniref:hypothetical protein n=1 Tax=Nocardia sp. NPDC127526 TaxID=3345393 RepID=UPI0036360AE5
MSETAPPSEPIFTTATATSRGGGISVTATELGLPIAMRLDPAELWRDPADLAGDILRVCRASAHRAGLARRELLAGTAGLTDDVLDLLGLPRPGDSDADAPDAYEPRSWLEQPDE